MREKSYWGILSSGNGKAPGVCGAYCSSGDSSSIESVPLYLCLGAPSEAGLQVILLSLKGIEDSDSDFSDEETWLAEDAEDRYSAERLGAEEEWGADPA